MKILIIDDEKLIRWSLDKKLKSKGHIVFQAETGEEGIRTYESNFPDIVFLDNKLPGLQGIEVIKKLKSIDEDANIVFMTAHGSIDTAVEAMKLGAVEYLNKPFSFEEIELLIESILQKINSKNEIQLLKREQSKAITFDNIICESAKIKSIINTSKKIARSDSTTVLLLGESGTGKDVFAKAIHNESKRADKPFVTINCSSLPETLLESELFGYEKGAFTDARKQKKGLFEIAQKGTVFLDEIGEINLSTQVKLLNVLENRTIRRLGGTEDIQVDVRIIAATNKNMVKAIEEKTFREDLYYRLKIFQISLPALRERKEDIPVLMSHFIALFNMQFGKNVSKVDDDVKNKMNAYNWPGNVRELRNVMERAVILESENKLHVSDLPIEIRELNAETNDGTHAKGKIVLPEEGVSLEEVEKELIQQALQKTGNNKTRAAQLLGISRDTLRYKIKKHHIEVD